MLVGFGFAGERFTNLFCVGVERENSRPITS